MAYETETKIRNGIIKGLQWTFWTILIPGMVILSGIEFCFSWLAKGPADARLAVRKNVEFMRGTRPR